MATATRPCFYVTKNLNSIVGSDNISFTYFSGFAKEQKLKSINSMHNTILEKYGNVKILEISKASPNYLGQKLSAFNLQLVLNNGMHNVKTTVERFFQGSKYFEKGGPFEEIIFEDEIHPKKYGKLKDSGYFKGFRLFDKEYSINPTTYFYDWLYITALIQNKALSDELDGYDYFTDIEFNPSKSFSCQAKSVALFKGIKQLGILDDVLKDSDTFLEFYNKQAKPGCLF
ncbi:MAG: hypothetical protein MR376_02390 [Campylobacter lanienae]|uniref:DarT1-associated NADAR antitoxin family protein n=1 Tax=Campylobacter TaxID=194 RepID=UPI000A32B487|nr:MULTISPECIES: hypothetical protein [Campylobacter]MCI5539410.1 hypothetical protein [Campylobacter lanienae]MDY3132656.1 hypothetical protein [Campylobacter lanienae]